MNQTNKNYARNLNRRLKQWDESEMSSNLINQTRENLEMFYNKYGIETDDNYFATNLDLTAQQEKEYEKIMDAFGDQAGSSLKEMEREYNRLSDEYKSRWDVNSLEDFITFTDRMKQSQNDRVLKSIISSEQIADLYAVASNKNISLDTVDELLLFEYESQQEFYDKFIDQSRGNANNPLFGEMMGILYRLDNEENKSAWD